MKAISASLFGVAALITAMFTVARPWFFILAALALVCALGLAFADGADSTEPAQPAKETQS